MSLTEVVESLSEATIGNSEQIAQLQELIKGQLAENFAQRLAIQFLRDRMAVVLGPTLRDNAEEYVSDVRRNLLGDPDAESDLNERIEEALRSLLLPDEDE
jgi:regulator of replication initiation timing